MDYMCRLGSLGNSSTASGSSDPMGKQVRATFRPRGAYFFLPAVHLSISSLLFSQYSSSMSHFILAVNMSTCLGKHSCMSSTFLHTEWNLLSSLSENGDTTWKQSKVKLNSKLHKPTLLLITLTSVRNSQGVGGLGFKAFSNTKNKLGAQGLATCNSLNK